MATDFCRTHKIPDLTNRLMATYKSLGQISDLGQCPLPSFSAIIEIVDDLNEVIFPGFRRRQNLHAGNVLYHIGDLLDALHGKLAEQIGRSLRHEEDAKQGGRGKCDDRRIHSLGDEKSIAFLERLPELRQTLAEDVQAAYDGDPAATGLPEIIFCYPGLQAITIQRLAHELHRLQVPIIPRMMTELAHSRTGIDIHPGAQIGPGFFIDHGTGVVIGETSVIAARVKIYQGVTLGALSFPRDAQGNIIRGRKRHPTIEEGVVIYANATVLGGDTTVGAGSVIGAGVHLHKSVPPRTIVTVDTPSLRFRDAVLRHAS